MFQIVLVQHLEKLPRVILFKMTMEFGTNFYGIAQFKMDELSHPATFRYIAQRMICSNVFHSRNFQFSLLGRTYLGALLQCISVIKKDVCVIH